MKKSFGSFLNKKGKQGSPLKTPTVSRANSGSKKDELENSIPKSTALPSHSTRDLENAMEYIERYHTKFDGLFF